MNTETDNKDLAPADGDKPTPQTTGDTQELPPDQQTDISAADDGHPALHGGDETAEKTGIAPEAEPQQTGPDTPVWHAAMQIAQNAMQEAEENIAAAEEKMSNLIKQYQNTGK